MAASDSRCSSFIPTDAQWSVVWTQHTLCSILWLMGMWVVFFLVFTYNAAVNWPAWSPEAVCAELGAELLAHGACSYSALLENVPKHFSN